MKPQVAVVGLLAVILWTTFSFAAQAQPRYPVGSQDQMGDRARSQNWPTSSRKNSMAGKILIIDVRAPEQFQKETIPGAINIPLEVARRPSKENGQGYLHCLHLRQRTLKARRLRS